MHLIGGRLKLQGLGSTIQGELKIFHVVPIKTSESCTMSLLRHFGIR